MRRLILGAVLTMFSAVGLSAQTASSYVPLVPCRFLDTRISGGPLAAGSTTYLALRGACNVGETASSVFVTLAVVNQAAAGRALLYPSDVTRPLATSINFRADGVNSSLVAVRLCAPPLLECGGVDAALYVSQQTDVILDVVGYTVPLE